MFYLQLCLGLDRPWQALSQNYGSGGINCNWCEMTFWSGFGIQALAPCVVKCNLVRHAKLIFDEACMHTCAIVKGQK